MDNRGLKWPASLSEVAGTNIPIQNDEGKKEIANLSSKELGKRIVINEIIRAKQMSNGLV